MSLNTVYLALGSNLGDRMAHLRAALRHLEAGGGILVVQTSAVYENRAVGMENAAAFYNAVVEVKTRLDPLEFLERCLAVETRLGRVRSGGWTPRPIDLDVLYYSGLEMNTERLNLPHPRISERDFVACPLADIAPDLRLGNETVEEIAGRLGAMELTRVPKALWAEPSVRIIAAMATNRVIGKDGRLPWSIPEDWEVFLKKTRGGLLVMGRLTFDEMRDEPSWRKDREYLILTSQPDKVTPYGVRVVSTVKEAIGIAEAEQRPLWICGGESVYAEGLPLAEQLHLTRVHAEVEGDTCFPKGEALFAERVLSVDSNDANDSYTFEVYNRVTNEDIET